jgi:hypothetical protein
MTRFIKAELMHGLVKQMSLTLLFCLAFAAAVRAQATYTAASCSESAVAAAIASEQASPVDGDIISIPSCPSGAVWTSGITQTFANSVTIQGAGAEYSNSGGSSTSGTDQTIIYDEISSGASAFALTTSSGKTLRFTAIALNQPASGGTVTSTGLLGIAGTSTAARVDHCHFYTAWAGGTTLGISGGVEGVGDHDYFQSPATLSGSGVSFGVTVHNGANWNGAADGIGYASWNDTDHFGTSQFWFMEDDYFYYGTYLTDCNLGGRYVFRHDTITSNGGFANHGLSQGNLASCRAVEVYDNTFSYPGGSGGGAVFANNGGTELFWGNTATGWRWLTQLSIVRINNATYGETFPPNGWGYCGTAQQQSNGLNQDSPWDGNNVVATGYPCIQSPARGAGDLLSGSSFPNKISTTTGTQSWPHQVLDPIYLWENIYSDGGYSYSTEGFITDTTGMLNDNRDYYQQMAVSCTSYTGTCGEPGTFNGTVGINQSSSAPSGNCTAGTDPMTGGSAPGVGWWDTSNNTLYVCNPTNTWTAYYTPYTYPNPLTQGAPAPAPPTSLQATPH